MQCGECDGNRCKERLRLFLERTEWEIGAIVANEITLSLIGDEFKGEKRVDNTLKDRVFYFE